MALVDVPGAAKTVGAPRRELVFGFVSPLGVDKDIAEKALRNALSGGTKGGPRYQLEVVKVSEILELFADAEQIGSAKHNHQVLRRKELLMNAGDTMRKKWAVDSGINGDAVALAAISAIKEIRGKINAQRDLVTPDSRALDNFPAESVCYLIDSLKHPDELERLRNVYGPSFISVGIYATREKRLENLAFDSASEPLDYAERLLKRDENADEKHGQKVSDAFFITDFIVDVTKGRREVQKEFERLIRLLFGDPHITPTFSELGMYYSRAAQVRSSSLARQIGAAIMRRDGSIISVGTNDAPKPGGGQYWPEDDEDYKGRDRVYETEDTSDKYRYEVIKDILDKLEPILNESHRRMTADERVEALYLSDSGLLRRSKLRDNIDRIRAVHAEAAALLDCARHGVSCQGAVLFSTTFPCHECARHIVYAGIEEVVYLEPYPKSDVRSLFRDSIVIDDLVRKPPRKVLFRSFVGVAPPRFLEFFTVGSRARKQSGSGKILELMLGEKAPPQLPYYTPAPSAIIGNELRDLQKFLAFLSREQPLKRTKPASAPARRSAQAAPTSRARKS